MSGSNLVGCSGAGVEISAMSGLVGVMEGARNVVVLHLIALNMPFYSSVSVSVSTSDKPECRSETHAGSCTAWNMESNRMVACRRTRRLEGAMTPSILSSGKLNVIDSSMRLSR